MGLGQMIRKFSKEDIDQVSRIEKENFNRPWTREQFIQCHNQPFNFSNYVYCKSSNVIGYFVTENIVDEVHLHKIAVEKKYQNNKVGLKLIEYIINDSKMNSKLKICLEVDSSNFTALSLYNKLGFSAVGKRKKYYESRDAILMDLDIN